MNKIVIASLLSFFILASNVAMESNLDTQLLKEAERFALQNPEIGRLIQQGANPNAQDEFGNTPLINATRTGKDHLAVELLLKARANPNIVNRAGWSPLMFAAKNENHFMVDSLLAAGADPKLKNNKDKTAANLVPLGADELFKKLKQLSK